MTGGVNPIMTNDNIGNSTEKTDYDGIFKDIIRNFPNEIIELFFKGQFGKFDFSKTEFLSENTNSTDRRADEKRFPDVVQTAIITEPGEVTDITGEIIILWEPHSYEWSIEKFKKTFSERMYDYKNDVFYHHGISPTTKLRRKILPIALFCNKAQKNIETYYEVKGLETFTFYKSNIHAYNWKSFEEETNPVAAAFMGLMGVKEEEKLEAKVLAYTILSKNENLANKDLRKRDLIINAIETFLKLKSEEKAIFLELYNQKQKNEKGELAMLKSALETEFIKEQINSLLLDVHQISLDDNCAELINRIYDEKFLKNLQVQVLKCAKEKESKEEVQKTINLLVSNRQ